MSRPYEVGPGWWPMLDEQMEAARKIAPDVTHEEKEKYGRCDIYLWSEDLEGANDELYAIQDKVEELSLQICEFCGQPGHLRKDRNWMQTLCDRCASLAPLERRKVAEEVKEQYFDRKLYDQAMAEHEKNPVTYTHEQAKKLLEE